MRDDFGFTIGCLAASLGCGAKGTNFDFSAYTFPMYTEVKAGESLLTQCYRPAIGANCASGLTITAATSAPINGLPTEGTYNKVVRSPDGSVVIGCLRSDATVCPAAAPFSYITMAGPALAECRALGPANACNGTATTFNIPAYNGAQLSGCVTATTTCERALLPAWNIALLFPTCLTP